MTAQLPGRAARREKSPGRAERRDTSLRPVRPADRVRRGSPQLHPSLTVLVRRTGAVQLGWDPETAMLLQPPVGVSTDLVIALLRLLDGEHSRPQVVWQAAAQGLAPADARTILAELDAAGLLTDVGQRAGPQSVRVHGRGPLSDAICTGLGGSGVRLSRSAESYRPVTLDRDTEVRRWHAELVVLTDDLVTDPQLVRALMANRVPHLQVRIRDGNGVVGPLVLPGHTSCLRCADLIRCERDAEWPHLAAQLLGRVGYASPRSIQATAALALEELDVILAGSATVVPATFDATLELDLRSRELRRRAWYRHRLCDCGYAGSRSATGTDLDR